MCLVVACAWSVAASPADAQTAAGEITGIVKDQAGAAVPGATITVTETRTNRQRVTVSTDDGVYTAPSLAPGEYRLDVELAGFKPVRREGIRLSTGEKARIDFDLSVGDIRELVTVVADSPVVRVETASLGTVVENEQVVQLPLNGRLFIMLAAIAPGVALPPNSVLPRINGGRPRTNEYLFDGISVLQPEPGQLAFYPIIDAIQEFKIESNSPAAEFGRFNGGVVNLTTKSGTNAVHGNVFEFFRNEQSERQELLPEEQSGETGLSAESVRRHVRRPHCEGPDVRLCRLSGSATEHRPHGDLERAHARRTFRCLPPEHLRSGDDGGKYASAVSEQHDSEKRHGSGRAVASRALPAPDKHRHREQLQPDGQRSRQSGSGRCAPRSQVCDKPRSGVRTVDVLPWSCRTGDRLSGREWDHPGRQRGRRSAGYDGVGVCFELSTHLLDQRAERTAHRRYTAIRPAERGGVVFACGSRAQHSRHPVECAISQHDADLRTERLPAARIPE